MTEENITEEKRTASQMYAASSRLALHPDPRCTVAAFELSNRADKIAQMEIQNRTLAYNHVKSKLDSELSNLNESLTNLQQAVNAANKTRSVVVLVDNLLELVADIMPT